MMMSRKVHSNLFDLLFDLDGVLHILLGPLSLAVSTHTTAAVTAAQGDNEELC